MSPTIRFFAILAIAGDVLFLLWMLYNGINEGFRTRGTVELVSLLGLMGLLVLNAVLLLLWARKRKA